jgi:hypothetical protein
MKTRSPSSRVPIGALLFIILLAVLPAIARATQVSSARDDRAIPPGWNLVADPYGVVSSGPAYTIQAGDSQYEAVQAGTALVPGLGYWVYTAHVTGVPLAAGAAQATIHTTPGQWIMIGDPSGQLPAQVSGADAFMTYDPRTGFQAATELTLRPGQGAFALSLDGSDVSVVAQGTASTAACATLDAGSACPTDGACPPGYPVAITQDWLAHPPVKPGDSAVQGTILLCFNDLSQATEAGYESAPPSRLTLEGPESATTANIQITVLRALLETPQAFLARITEAGQQLCSSCNLSAATAVVTVEYSLQNFDDPPTAVSTGQFVAAGESPESAPAYGLVAGQNPPDPVHQGFPVSGTISSAFTKTPFSDIDIVTWELDNPLSDTLTSLPQPHGPSVSFDLNFAGGQAGTITANGDQGVVPPAPCYVETALFPCYSAVPTATPTAAGPGAATPTAVSGASPTSTTCSTAGPSSLTCQGAGNFSSPTFTPANSDWALNWSFSNCPTSNGSFAVDILLPDGTASSNQSVSQSSSGGNGVQYLHSGGTFFLKVTSNCAWSIQAQ